jgi:hypothetical protein
MRSTRGVPSQTLQILADRMPAMPTRDRHHGLQRQLVADVGAVALGMLQPRRQFVAVGVGELIAGAADPRWVAFEHHLVRGFIEPEQAGEVLVVFEDQQHVVHVRLDAAIAVDGQLRTPVVVARPAAVRRACAPVDDAQAFT